LVCEQASQSPMSSSPRSGTPFFWTNSTVVYWQDQHVYAFVSHLTSSHQAESLPSPNHIKQYWTGVLADNPPDMLHLMHTASG
ncbi:MAG: hypothetical protein J2P36_11090, partial [Ktedonobacteraceae bacterium]|nr:hypothetical protein [Ktedonobacteraceae bacterium]